MGHTNPMWFHRMSLSIVVVSNITCNMIGVVKIIQTKKYHCYDEISKVWIFVTVGKLDS